MRAAAWSFLCGSGTLCENGILSKSMSHTEALRQREKHPDRRNKNAGRFTSDRKTDR
jgi:hypothetical protein